MLEDYDRVIRLHSVYVAESSHRLAGFVVLIREQAELLLDNIAIHPDFQGRGIGSELMHFAETWARNAHYPAIDLYTHECMTENLTIYLKRGYVETDRREVKGYARIYMRKLLV